jgi:hypothetical protein
MTKRVATTRKKPAESPPAGSADGHLQASKPEKPVASRPKVTRATKATIKQALDELGINVPYYTARVVGGRLELALYGGRVVYWPAPPKEEA